MPRLCPRIRFHKDGTASLHGIQRTDLISIMTAARLHYYDDADKREKTGKTLDLDSTIWYKRMETILDLAKDLADWPRLKEFNYAMRPLHSLTPWQIKERTAKAKSQAKFRKTLDKMFADMRNKG